MNRVTRLILLSFFIFFVCSVNAQKVFDFNNTCQQAYAAITSLKLQTGQQLINEARKQNADNLIPDMLEDYIDFFILFLNEDPAEYKKRKENFSLRLDKLEEGPHNSPFYRFSKGLVHLHLASVEIKFGERFSAAWDFKKVFGLIKDNKKQFPSFSPNNMIYGPLQVMVGTIPKGYKWFAGLFGVRGSVKDGMKLMQSFLNGGDSWSKIFFTEGVFYYNYLSFYIENKPEDAFRFIQEKKLDVVNNQLFTYMAANLGINFKQTEYAKNIILHRNPSPDYLQTPVWNQELGYVYLHHLELNEAIQQFQYFLKTFKGNFYVKDVYNKLGWCYYLQGNMQAAEATRKLLLNKGTTETDADKKAQKDARSGIWPNPLLLKARLLNDGGYHKDALSLLYGKSASDFSSSADQLEFTYRAARIYDDLERDDDAIRMYQTSITLGLNRTEYYAARAALQIGYILEKRGKKAEAVQYYEKCLAMEDHEYKDSIDQRAKAGIERCRE
ncbi:MAG: hypothetical protein JWN76_1643 [Chitinophagaceae bacterium]|nr:hypothetical protein [Chitinophagaceae bacterium]